MLKIIAAEDEYLQRKSLIKLIKQWSADTRIVGEAESGNEVLTLLGAESADLVITDIKMPNTDGIELAKIIKNTYPDVRVVIVTGHSEFCLAQKAIEYGVKNYILKPINKKEFWKVLSELYREISRTSRNTFEKHDDYQNEYPFNDIINYFHNNYDQNIHLRTICRKFPDISYEYIQKNFVSKFGQSFHDYCSNYRIQKAKEFLLKGNNVTETAQLVGFQDTSYFVKVFKRITGETPKTWIQERT